MVGVLQAERRHGSSAKLDELLCLGNRLHGDEVEVPAGLTCHDKTVGIELISNLVSRRKMGGVRRAVGKVRGAVLFSERGKRAM